MASLNPAIMILLADNSKDGARLTDYFKQDDNFIVVGAAGCDDVIEWLESHHVDVIILDEKTEGWETLSIIGDHECGWPDIPVVFLSSSADSEEPIDSIETAQKAWGLGANKFVPKPAEINTIVEAVYKTAKALA